MNIVRRAGDWWVEVIDRDPEGWCAITEPVEVGRLSWLSGKILKSSTVLILFGLGALAAGGLCTVPRRSMP